jgi:hypothetical protein
VEVELGTGGGVVGDAELGSGGEVPGEVVLDAGGGVPGVPELDADDETDRDLALVAGAVAEVPETREPSAEAAAPGVSVPGVVLCCPSGADGVGDSPGDTDDGCDE